jgi:hypothetical protein
MNFGEALSILRSDGRVQRAGWSGKGMWLRIYDPYLDREFSTHENGNVYGFDSGTLAPWIGMHTADNKFVPWLASQTDLLAEDWQQVFAALPLNAAVS